MDSSFSGNDGRSKRKGSAVAANEWQALELRSISMAPVTLDDKRHKKPSEAAAAATVRRGIKLKTTISTAPLTVVLVQLESVMKDYCALVEKGKIPEAIATLEKLDYDKEGEETSGGGKRKDFRRTLSTENEESLRSGPTARKTTTPSSVHSESASVPPSSPGSSSVHSHRSAPSSSSPSVVSPLTTLSLLQSVFGGNNLENNRESSQNEKSDQRPLPQGLIVNGDAASPLLFPTVSSSAPPATTSFYLRNHAQAVVRGILSASSSLSPNRGKKTKKQHEKTGQDQQNPNQLSSPWRHYTMPFLLLSRAEYLYANLEHLNDLSDSSVTLVGEEAYIENDTSANLNHDPLKQGRERRIQGRQRVVFPQVRIQERDTSGVEVDQQDVLHTKEESCEFGLKRPKLPQGVAAHKLQSLYCRIGQEMKEVKRDLCEPILRAAQTVSENAENNIPSKPFGLEEAESLYPTLSCLMEVAAIRSELIEIQVDVILRRQRLIKRATTPNSEKGTVTNGTCFVNYDGSGCRDGIRPSLDYLLHAARRCEHLLLRPVFRSSCNTQQATQSRNRFHGVAGTFVDSIKREAGAFAAAFNSAYFLCQCRFMETVIQMRKLKKLSPPSENFSPLNVWLQDTFQHCKAVMPIVFDRVCSYASLHYGFESSTSFRTEDVPAGSSGMSTKRLSFQTNGSAGHSSSATPGDSSEDTDEQSVSSMDYNAQVMDFLRSQDNPDGPRVAIGVILDAGSGGLATFERGYIPSISPRSDEECARTRGQQSARKLSSGGTPLDCEGALVDGLRSWPAVFVRTNSNARCADTPRTNKGAILNSDEESGSMAAILRRVKQVRSRDVLSDGSLFGGVLGTSSSSIEQVSEGVSRGHGVQSGVHSPATGLPPQPKRSSYAKKDAVDEPSLTTKYWPPFDGSVWPDTEWPNLVSLLTDLKQWNASNQVVHEGTPTLTLGRGDVLTHHEHGPGLITRKPRRDRPKTVDQLPTDNAVTQPVSMSSGSLLVDFGKSLVTDIANEPHPETLVPRSSERSSCKSGKTTATTFHVSPICEELWLAMLVEGEGDLVVDSSSDCDDLRVRSIGISAGHQSSTRPARKKVSMAETGLSDEKVHGFMQQLATELDPAHSLSCDAVRKARWKTEEQRAEVRSSNEDTQRRLSIDSNLSARALNNAGASGSASVGGVNWLDRFQQAVGLETSVERLLQMTFGAKDGDSEKRSRAVSLSTSWWIDTDYSDEESAAWMFLGPQLFEKTWKTTGDSPMK